tara:strand:- start:1329 stop:2129 length:801 start_codon:yes stop_codon:yes gene_type:complete
VNSFNNVRSYIVHKFDEKLRKINKDFESTLSDCDLMELVDSFGFLDLLTELENEFGVEVNFEEFDPEDFTTLNNLSHCIGDLIPGKNKGLSRVNSFKKKEYSKTIDDKFTFRKAKEKDINLISQMWEEMYKEQKIFGMLMKLNKKARLKWRDKTLRSLSSEKSLILAVYTKVEKPVGFLTVQLKWLPEIYESSNSQMVGFVDNLYIDKDFRGQGLAEKLYSVAKIWFKQKNVKSVELQVIVNNKSGRNFWSKLGFKEELLQMRTKL